MPNPYRREQDRANGPHYDAPDRGPAEYHQGDRPFQFPWWVILIAFIGAWPLGLLLLAGNFLLRSGTAQYPQDSTAAQEVRRRAGQAVRRAEQKARGIAEAAAPHKAGNVLPTVLTVVGACLLAVGILDLPNALYWLPDAIAEGGTYWSWVLEDFMGCAAILSVGAGGLFAGWKLRAGRRMRRKIDNIVGDAPCMKIRDIADAIPCSYEKCCKYLESCIDKGVFGPDAYLDMRTKTLVVRGTAPAPEPEQPQTEQTSEHERYAAILRRLHELNDAIPGEEMSEKISRLETLSAKIFAQAEQNPDKLPQMRKFMDYYLPTSLKLLETYAELDAQGVEGENIRESKQRIEQVMGTLVTAFENQLDKLFQADALDVSADIDVMENMLRADGLTVDGKGQKLTL